MNRLLAIAAVAAGVVALFAVTTPSGHAVAPRSAATRMHFKMRFSPFLLVDLGDKGPSGGDEIVSHDALRDAHGRTVGHDGTVCTVTDPKLPEAQCLVTFSLPGGVLTAQFLNKPPPRKTAVITGGSGRYTGAEGRAIIVESAKGRGGSATFLLTLPAGGSR